MKYSNLQILTLVSFIIFVIGAYSSNMFIILQSLTLGVVALLGFLWLGLENMSETTTSDHKFFNIKDILTLKFFL